MKKEIVEYLDEKGVKEGDTRFNLIYKMVEGFADKMELKAYNPFKSWVWWLTAICVVVSFSLNVERSFDSDPEIYQSVEREYEGDRWILDTYCREIGFHKSDTGVADKIDVMKDWRLQQCEDLLDTLNMLND